MKTEYALFYGEDGQFALFQVRLPRSPGGEYYVASVVGRVYPQWLIGTVQKSPLEAVLALATAAGREWTWFCSDMKEVRARFAKWSRKYTGWKKVTGRY